MEPGEQEQPHGSASSGALPGGVQPGAISALLADLARAPSPASGWTEPPMPGEKIGRFLIGREIGRGGFGVIYQARDEELGREVAFKAVRASATALPEEQVLAEAEAAARLTHPNIVTLHDLGRCERGVYLILELLKGESLKARLQRGLPERREALRIAVEIARGLAHAHGAGVVHRDLTPGNIFLCEGGQVKVLDFGLARVLGKGGASGGTAGYMSPEQAQGRPTDARSDVYGLGVIVHQLFTGRLPFPTGSGGLPAGAAPLPLPGAPGRLQRLVSRMLSAAPDSRPASGKEALQELAAILAAAEGRRALLGWGVALLLALVATGIALRPRPAPLPPGRLLVALADAANTTGDSGLDGVSQLLGTALEQSRRVSLIARSRLVESLRAGNQRLPARLGEAETRLLARKLQAHTLLVPSVRLASAGYAVELRAVDVLRDEPIFTVREQAQSRANVVAALDRLSDRARQELQESPEDAAQPRVRLAKLAVDPEAWRLWAEGKKLASEGLRKEALAAWEQVLRIDPDFALVHVQLALPLEFDDQEGVRRHLEAARRGLDRLPAKERLEVELHSASLKWDFPTALALADKLIAGWPQEPSGYQAAAYAMTDAYADLEGARPYLEKALELAALQPPLAIRYALFLGRLDEAVARAQRWVAEAKGAPSLAALSAAHRLRSEPAEARDAALRALAARSDHKLRGVFDPVFWSLVEAGAIDEVERADALSSGPAWYLLALQGRHREALLAFDATAPAPDSPDSGQAFFHNWRAEVVLEDGRDRGLSRERLSDLIWTEVSEVFRLGSASISCMPDVFLIAGDVRRAERLAANHANMMDPRLLCAALQRHLFAWRRGDTTAAITGLSGMLMPIATYDAGELLLEAGRDREAIEALRRFRRWPEWDQNSDRIPYAWPRSLYLEATALERLGQRAEALAVVERLLALWKRADPGLLPLRDAKALRARLAQAGAPLEGK